MRNNPCFNCSDRYPGCHGKCSKEEYLKFKETVQKIRENKTKYLKQEYEMFDINNRRKRK